MYFDDRRHAGQMLGVALAGREIPADAIVLGIPRGGVVVAAEVAKRLGLPLDVAVAAKVGAPSNPEFAIGAVAPDGEVTPNPGAGYSAGEVRASSTAAAEKVRKYTAGLRQGRPALDLNNRVVLLVDDGLATGLTAIAATQWVRRQGAARVVVAVPVASGSAVAALEREADEVVSLDIPPGFYAVGQFYKQFGQTQDDEVIRLLEEAAPRRV